MKRLLVGRINKGMMMVQGADGSMMGRTLPKITPKEIVPEIVPVVTKEVTREDAFNYIYSIKDHLDIKDSSFCISYQYKGADIEMVVVEGDVVYLEINPSIPAWMNGRYKNFPTYTQVKGMA